MNQNIILKAVSLGYQIPEDYSEVEQGAIEWIETKSETCKEVMSSPIRVPGGWMYFHKEESGYTHFGICDDDVMESVCDDGFIYFKYLVDSMGDFIALKTFPEIVNELRRK